MITKYVAYVLAACGSVAAVSYKFVYPVVKSYKNVAKLALLRFPKKPSLPVFAGNSHKYLGGTSIALAGYLWLYEPTFTKVMAIDIVNIYIQEN